MQKQTGTNIQDLKIRNRLLILRLIATSCGISRVDLARRTGLAKMTVGNIVGDLLDCGLVEELALDEHAPIVNYGRRPIMLVVAHGSPCICGMLIKRGLCQVVLSNLDGAIFEQLDYEYQRLDGAQALVDLLLEGFEQLQKRTGRRIAAIGVSSVGPLDAGRGVILAPPYFYGIENLEITGILRRATGLPTYLVNDANAGALAEKLFGRGRELQNFVYLHIMNGVGAGLILQNKLYNGDSGQSGEIGHTSINFSGPKCVCGNTGCLDLYANLDNMSARIRESAPFYKESPLAQKTGFTWREIVDAGNAGDPLAMIALDEFCAYIAYSMVDMLNLLDLSHIIVGYDAGGPGTMIEDLLRGKISKSVLCAKYHELTVLHSSFMGNAPLVGSIAAVADRLFSMDPELGESLGVC